MATYKIVAVNDDECTCAHCGKTNLKQVAWLVELDEDRSDIGNVPFPVGTTCAAKLTATKKTKVAKTLKSYNHLVFVAREEMMRNNPLSQEINNLFRSVEHKDDESYEDYWDNNPSIIKARKLQDKLKAWADAQEVIILL